MLKNVADIKHCFGCGVCLASCPKKCLDLVLNPSGFFHPVMRESAACINCGQCLKCCSYLNDGLAITNGVVEWGIAWSKNVNVRRESSSGGFAYELSRKAIQNGFKVCGVRYNIEKHRAEHVICETEKELACLQGSKYLQSYTATAFQSFERNSKYLVFGSPCQIDSLRRLIQAKDREDDFILVDFFCHGVPSYLVWNKYLKDVLFAEGKAKRVEFRHKWNHSNNTPVPWSRFIITGWDEGGNVYQPYLNQPDNDWFYRYFLGDLCLGEQCYGNCKFKMLQSSADLRIGDAWGKAFQSNGEGTSVVLSYTHKTDRLLQELRVSSVAWQSIRLDDLCEGQMEQNPPIPRHYRLRLNLLRTSLGFNKIDFILAKLGKWDKRIHKLYERFHRHLNNASSS